MSTSCTCEIQKIICSNQECQSDLISFLSSLSIKQVTSLEAVLEEMKVEMENFKNEMRKEVEEIKQRNERRMFELRYEYKRELEDMREIMNQDFKDKLIEVRRGRDRSIPVIDTPNLFIPTTAPDKGTPSTPTWTSTTTSTVLPATLKKRLGKSTKLPSYTLPSSPSPTSSATSNSSSSTSNQSQSQSQSQSKLKKSDVSEFTKLSDTQLHSAVREGSLPMIEQIIKKGGTPINSKNNTGSTPLHLAARYGHLEICQFLLESNADLEAIDFASCTPLHYASWKGSVPICELFLEKNAKVNVLDNNLNSPLHYSTYYGNEEVCKLLIKYNADLFSQNIWGKSPKEWIGGKNEKEIARLFV